MSCDLLEHGFSDASARAPRVVSCRVVSFCCMCAACCLVSHCGVLFCCVCVATCCVLVVAVEVVVVASMTDLDFLITHIHAHML